jgi:hypothetical protein
LANGFDTNAFDTKETWTNMKTKLNSFFALFLVAGCGLLGGSQTQAACPQDTLKLNSLCFLPSAGQPQWVAVTNTGGESVVGAGVELVGNGGAYSLPSRLESIPPGGIVMLVFDGAGTGSNDYSFAGDNKAVLHTEPGLPSATNFLGSPVGFCSLYRVTGAHSKETILDFVAWGGEPGEAASDAVENRVWAAKNVFIWTDPANPPLGPIPQFVTNGSTIARSGLVGWQVCLPASTKGKRLSAPKLTSPASGQFILENTRKLRFLACIGATEYEVQIATDDNFANAVRSFRSAYRMSGVGVVPALPLHQQYWWRVRALAPDGSASDWSEPANFILGHPLKPSSAPPSGTKSGHSMTGKIVDSGVTDSLANKGLPGATVVIGTRSSTSGANGEFTVTGLESGTYLVSVSRAHYSFPTPTTVLITDSDVAGIEIAGTGERANLNVTPLAARKETTMLAITPGAVSYWAIFFPVGKWMCDRDNSRDQAWDKPLDYPSRTSIRNEDLESWWCWAVGATMINRFYGGTITRDEVVFAVKKDLLHSADAGARAGECKSALKFVLNATDADIDSTWFKPSEAQIKEWVDQGRPIYTSMPGHIMVIDGYKYERGVFYVHHVNNDNDGGDGFDSWEAQDLAPDGLLSKICWCPKKGLKAKLKDSRLSAHTGSDEVNDFDKEVRFQPSVLYPAGYGTMNTSKSDSDGDGVLDKVEVASWVFPTNIVNGGDVSTGKFRSPDVDNDKLYPEVDEDSDNGGIKDGDEDKNYNGIVDAGEADPFNAKDDKSIDLVFCIDNTGSMSDDIAAVKAQAINILNKTAIDYPNFRVAVVGYRDYPVDPYGDPGDYLNRDFIAFSTNRAAITAAINSMAADGGNDFEEAVYSALLRCNDASTLGGWRKDPVTRKILLMNDAPPHDPEPFSGYNMSTVVAALSKGGVVWEQPYSGIGRTKDGETELSGAIGVISVFVGSDSTTREFDRRIAEETDGVLVEARSASDVPGAVLAALESIRVAPTVSLEVSGAYGQTNILADASKSVDPQGCGIIKYEWDWDGDGTYDEWTFGALAAHSYPLGFEGKVRVRATAVSGETGTATYVVTAPVAPVFVDVTPDVDFQLASPRLDQATGALICDMVLTVKAGSIKTLKDKFWFALPSTTNVMLAFPDGTMTNGMLYVDITSLVTNALAAAGGDLLLSPGEQVIVTNALAVYSRDLSLPTGFVFAVWADPPPPAPPTRPITLSLVEHAQSHGQLRVRISGSPNSRHVVEVSPDLIHWTTSATVTNVTGTLEFFDPAGPGQSQRFYRVR